jgi:TPR repeat protein
MNELLVGWDHRQADMADAALMAVDPARDRVAPASANFRDDPAASFAVFVWGAAQGSVLAMRCLAWCYETGSGVSPDAATAEDWYRRAFEAGSMRALLDYGERLKARGDLELRELVYRAGAANNFIPAFNLLAYVTLLKSRSPEAFRTAQPLFERAVAAGSPRARALYGHHLSNGRYGLHNIPRGWVMMSGVAVQGEFGSPDFSRP